MKMRRIALSVLLIATLAGCGEPAEDRVRDSALTVAYSVLEGNSAKACGLIADPLRAKLEESGKSCLEALERRGPPSAAVVPEYRIADIRVNSKKATARVERIYPSGRIDQTRWSFLEVDDEWKLSNTGVANTPD